MALYSCDFLLNEFEDYPQIPMADIIKAKFLSEHGIAVDETMLALDENGNVLNEITSTEIKIVVEVP